MFFQTVFIILGGFIIEQECPLDSLTDLLCYESYCIPSGRLPRVINCAFDQSFYAKSEMLVFCLFIPFPRGYTVSRGGPLFPLAMT